MRKKCLRVGHKFRNFEGIPLPYIFCSRWGCNASAVTGHAPPGAAVSLHNAIPREHRFPPVELDVNGLVIETWEEGSAGAKTTPRKGAG